MLQNDTKTIRNNCTIINDMEKEIIFGKGRLLDFTVLISMGETEVLKVNCIEFNSTLV